MLLFAIPCYGGHVPALYRAWNERIAHIPNETDVLEKFEDFQRIYLNKILGFIIVGNLTAGGDMALHEVLCDFYNIQHRRISLKGDLVEVPAVKERLNNFIDLLIKRITEKHHE